MKCVQKGEIEKQIMMGCKEEKRMGREDSKDDERKEGNNGRLATH